MADKEKLTREWVEVAEESDGGAIHLRPSDYPIPPARGRRHLSLEQRGGSEALGAGATDKLESIGSGSWSLDGDTLHVTAPGWEGNYQIEKLTDDLLILRKR
jgi:hypothetical protein